MRRRLAPSSDKRGRMSRRSKRNERLSSKDTDEEETGSLIRQERENEQEE